MEVVQLRLSLGALGELSRHFSADIGYFMIGSICLS